MMRWVTTLATAALAEVLGHFLSLGWGFMTLIAAFAVIAVRVNSVIATVNSKAYSVENRLDAHVTAAAPAINLQANGGTIGGNTTVSGTISSGNASVGALSTAGQVLVNGASGGATVEVQGNGHITSTLQVDSAITAGSSISASGQVLAGGAVSSATFAVNGNGHITGGLQVDGSIVTASGGSIPQGAPSTAGSFSQGTMNVGTSNMVAWAASVTTIVNNIRSQLLNAGVFNLNRKARKMFNSANSNPGSVIGNVQQGLIVIRAAMNVAGNLYASSSGIALADLTGIGMASADANAILSACADANALSLYYNTGLPPGTYPQPPTAYVYGASQRAVIGLRAM